MFSEPQDNFEEPPAPKSKVLLWSGIGFALCIVSMALGQAARGLEEMSALHRGAVGCMIAGFFIAGCSITLRPSWYAPWFLMAGCGLAATFGLPESWDSIRKVTLGTLLLGSLGGILNGLRGTAPRVIASGCLLFHYLGIQMAILSPPPTSWLVFQTWQRGLGWWFESIYMNNAYQFYSPDPGPANQLWFCLEFRKENVNPEERSSYDILNKALGLETLGDKNMRWLKLPLRPTDLRDPLAITYFRRLALTEYANQMSNGNWGSFAGENNDIQRRRQMRIAEIPLSNRLPVSAQFRAPNDVVCQLLLPSYARHVAEKYKDLYKDTMPDMKLYSVRIYRALHMINEAENFAKLDNNLDRDDADRYIPPNDPSTYQVYFQGEFLPNGTLKDRNDPMLFWLLPIERIPGHKVCKFTDKDYLDNYLDFVKVHAGSPHWGDPLQRNTPDD